MAFGSASDAFGSHGPPKASLAVCGRTSIKVGGGAANASLTSPGSRSASSIVSPPERACDRREVRCREVDAEHRLARFDHLAADLAVAAVVDDDDRHRQLELAAIASSASVNIAPRRDQHDDLAIGMRQLRPTPPGCRSRGWRTRSDRETAVARRAEEVDGAVIARVESPPRSRPHPGLAGTPTSPSYAAPWRSASARIAEQLLGLPPAPVLRLSRSSSAAIARQRARGVGRDRDRGARSCAAGRDRCRP